MSRFKSTTLAAIAAIFMAFTASSAMAHPGGLRGVAVLQPDKVDWGLTTFLGPAGVMHLVGLDGRIINQWGSLADQILWAKPIYDPAGDILALTTPTVVPGYVIPLPTKMVQYDVDGNTTNVWENFEIQNEDVEFAALHHDMARLPNGNTLIVCLAIVNDPSISPDPLLDDCIIEVDWQGNVVWEWYTYQHFDQFGFTDLAKGQISEFAGDWAHANSISILPPNTHADPAFAAGNIMVSYRQINTVVIIDKDTGDIVWSLGPNGSLSIGQHDAQMIPPDLPGAGNIIMFDNGLRAGFPPVSRPFSQVIEVEPNSKTIVWRYNALFSGFPQWDFFSPIISGAQRLINGNTMITEGTKGRLIEVTEDGEIVWEYLSPFGETNQGPSGRDVTSYSIFRAYRMPLFWGWPSSLTDPQ